MCECCGGDCRLCAENKGYLEFPEPITKMYIREVVDRKGCTVEEMIVNDKYRLLPTGNPDSPFRREEMKQPINEAYKNEILEAYQKISDTFDDFTQLMRARIPYDSWPDHCKIAGVSEDLMGCTKPGEHIQVKIGAPPPKSIPLTSFTGRISHMADEATKELEKALRDGWHRVQPDCRPDESFRAMIEVMEKWKDFINNLPNDMISRLQNAGKAQDRIIKLLDDEIFESTSKHNPYWHSKHEEEADKLDDLRRKISCFHDNLWDIVQLLRKEEE